MKKTILFVILFLLLAPAFAAWPPLESDKYYIHVQMLENNQPIALKTGRVLLYAADQDSPWPSYYELRGYSYIGEQGRLRFVLKKFMTNSANKKSYKYYMKAQFKSHPEHLMISPTYLLDSTHNLHGTQAQEYKFYYSHMAKGQGRKIDLHIEVEKVPGPKTPPVNFNQIQNAEPMR